MVRELFDDRQLRLLEYWCSKRGDRPAPRRADIDPLDIPDILPTLTLLEVLYCPLQFRFRLVGTAVVNAMGRDSTGRFVDEQLYGAAGRAVFATCRRLTEEKCPFHRRSQLTWNGRAWRVLEALELPLLDDGGRVSMILGGHRFTTSPHTLEEPRVYEPLQACEMFQ